MPTRRADARAVAMVLGAALSVQLGAGVATGLFERVGALGATTARLGIAALVLLVVVRPRVRGWTRRQWGLAVAFGAALGCMNASFYEAVARIPLGVAVTLEFLGPLVLSAVLAPRRRDLAWVAVALAGVVLLGLGGDGGGGALDPVGVVLALVAGAFWAAYVLLASRVGAAVEGQAGLAVAGATAALLVLPAGVLTQGAALLDPHVLLVGTVVALASSVLPYSLELSALRRLPARTFGVLLSLEPGVAALVGFVLLGQGLPWTSVLAVCCVVVASAGATRAAGRRDEVPPLG